MRTTPEKRKATLTKYNNTPERKQAMKEYYEKNKDRSKDRMLMRNYGISLDDYNKMLAEQNGNCYVCEKHHTSQKKSLSVDHCHKTGNIRRLLCSNCNTSLGLLKEDITRVKKLIQYIEENKIL
jgi:hypothetical protein